MGLNLQEMRKIGLDISKDGEIKFTLTWRGERCLIDRLLKRHQPVLGLGCFYLTDFGGRSLIDRLQFAKHPGARNQMTRQGGFDMVPYIWHEGVERADSGECVESIIVNNTKINKLKRLSIYAFSYLGKPRWNRIQPQLNVEIPGHETLTFDFSAKSKRKCRMLAMLNITVENETLIIASQHTLFHGHRDCNEALDWQLNVAP